MLWWGGCEDTLTGDTKLGFKASGMALVIKRVVPNLLNQSSPYRDWRYMLPWDTGKQPSSGHTLLLDWVELTEPSFPGSFESWHFIAWQPSIAGCGLGPLQPGTQDFSLSPKGRSLWQPPPSVVLLLVPWETPGQPECGAKSPLRSCARCHALPSSHRQAGLCLLALALRLQQL